jgi:hypothetical protein
VTRAEGGTRRRGPRSGAEVSPELKLGALGDWARIESQITGEPVPRAPRAPRRAAELAAAFAAAVGKLVVLVLLPLLALVRVATFWYVHHRSSAWLALALGAGSTFVLVTLYAAWISHRLSGRVRLAVLGRRVALPLVVAYCGYALIYLSSANAKSDRVRAYYTSVHPLLRVALSTWILVDQDLLITDLARRPEDYTAMGLPMYDGSLHYAQPDGYVHAADLRTVGRSVVKNWLVQLYFVLMGFDTLRHVGTADHLHVELPLR